MISSKLLSFLMFLLLFNFVFFPELCLSDTYTVIPGYDINSGAKIDDSGESILISTSWLGDGNLTIYNKNLNTFQNIAQHVPSLNSIDLSGDGNTIVYVRKTFNFGFYNVYAYDKITGTEKCVAKHYGSDQCGFYYSNSPSISRNGRFISFSSQERLDQNFPNSGGVYLHDMVNDTTELVSLSNEGIPGNSISEKTAVSDDGNIIVFNSYSDNLVQSDTNNAYDVFIRDRSNNKTTRISVANDGTQGISPQYGETVSDLDISKDGSLVVFSTNLMGLVPNTNGIPNIYAYSVKTSTIEIVSKNTSDEFGNGHSTSPQISADGRYITFVSIATNLAGADNNSVEDVFVYDTKNGRTIKLDLFRPGEHLVSRSPSINADGRYVSFVKITQRNNLRYAPYTEVILYDRGVDYDSDGFFAEEDCNDNDANINPFADEIFYNQSDENCNGIEDDIDDDGDGFGFGVDCNDSNPNINPAVAEIPYNGIDENCNMADDDDADRDGYGITTDCRDNDSAIHPGAAEIPYNGSDENCNGLADDTDFDLDGYDSTIDCDDNDPASNPGADEIHNNEIDENCSGLADDTDFDLDGYDSTIDCDDNDPAINPGAYETYSNDIDENCNGMADDADASVMVDSTADTVQQLPVAALLPPTSTGSTNDTTVAENRIGALQNMITAVSDKLATVNDTMINAEKLMVYNDCLADLNAILAKTDGFYGGNPNNDWVTTQEGQNLLYPQVQNAINFVQGEIAKLTTP